MIDEPLKAHLHDRNELAEQLLCAGEVELCCVLEGSRKDPPLLLLAGLGMQLVSWPDAFCARLVEAGFFVIRYDHRDTGRSTYFDDAGLPDLLRALRKDPLASPYRLEDLAHDALCLLDALGIEQAHLLGVSMGGMVAQLLAIEHPTRVASLCSAMSTTGAPGVGQIHNDALAVLVRAPAGSEADAIEQWLTSWRVTRSPGFDFDEDYERDRARRAYQRANHPAGSARQLAAILTASDRTSALGSVRAPTLVVHGRNDPLIDVSGGIATAAAIPDARLLLIDGMGHDLPLGAWDEIITALCDNAARARSRGPTRTIL